MDRFPFVDDGPEYTDALNENDTNNKLTIEEIGQRTLEPKLCQDREPKVNVKAGEPSNPGARTTNKANGNHYKTLSTEYIPFRRFIM